MERKTALTVQEYRHFGGKSFDFVAHASMFRDDAPYQFGIKTAQVFSAELGTHQINKKWTYFTAAQGNMYVIPGGKDEFEWGVMGDSEVDFRVVALLETPGSLVGKDNSIFRIVLDRDWLNESITLKGEGDNDPLITIIGHGEPSGTGIGTVYTCELQDGNSNSYLTTDAIDVGKLFVRVGAPVADEENYKFAGDSYGGYKKLRGICGQVAGGIEFTDKFVRAERDAAKANGVPSTGYTFQGQTYYDALYSGLIYQADLRDNTNKKITKGMFISAAEARLLERTEMDRELMCEFGRLQYTIDYDTKRVKKIAPGWREIVREGQYFPHSGSFTLDQLYDFLHQVYMRRRDFESRKPMLVSGTGGITFLSNLIAQQASVFQTLEPGLLVGKRTDGGTGVNSNELWYGGQFTQIKLPMGIIVEVMYDPIKDNDQYFRQKAPGSYLPLESFQIDVLDFGKSANAAKGSSGENITMVSQSGVDAYWSTCNIVDIRKGPITDGSNSYGQNKTCGIYRELAGSLAVWDCSRVGRIEWCPA